ncbi:MAG: hypothetical protein SF052_10050 [Bacteroidia bacterium]|nr:hypothetical protein [Bacteroidia bacterium]
MALNRGRKGWKWVIGIFLFFLVVIFLFFNFFLGPAIQTAASRAVEKNSRGLYALHIRNVEWSLVNRSFSLTGISLTHDSTRLNVLGENSKPRPFLIGLYIPEVKINFFKLYRLLRYKEVFIRSLRVYNPRLQVFRLSEHTKTFRPEDLHQFLSDFLHTLDISYLQIEGGVMTIQNPQTLPEEAFIARDISIEMMHFRIDSTTLPQWDRPFYAEKISASMAMGDYSFVLPDSSYVIRAGRMGISSQNHEVFAENLHIQPGSRVWAQKETAKSFDIYIPQLRIEENALYKTWFERRLDLRKVRLIQPVFIQKNFQENRPLAAPQWNHTLIRKAIHQWFHEITVGELSVEEGIYREVNDWNDTTGRLSVKGLGLNLTSVRLDSGNKEHDSRLLFSEHFSLYFRSLHTRLSQNNYTLRTGPAEISSKEGSFFVQNVILQANTDKFARALLEGGDVVSLKVPRVLLRGLDMPRIWHHRVLSVGWIEIQRPEVELINKPQVEREVVDSLAQANLYDLVADELRSFSIRNFFVRSGKFNFNTSTLATDNEFAASDIHVHIKNFRLSPDTTLRRENPFYADDIAITANIADYSFLLPDSSYAIRAAVMGISTADSAIFADSVRIIPRDTLRGERDSANHHHIHGFIPRVYLSGLDLRQIWFYKTLVVDSLHLTRPAIAMHSTINTPHKVEFRSLDSLNLYPYIASRLNALEIHHVVIDSAGFSRTRKTESSTTTLRVPELAMEIKGFKLAPDIPAGPENILYSKDIRLTIKHLSELLSDSIHRVSTENIFISTAEGKIAINNIRIQPDTNLPTPANHNLYQFYSPNLLIEGLDSYELYEKKILDLDRVAIYSPDLSLENYPRLEKKEMDSLARADLYLLISDQLNALKIRSFLVMNGVVRLNENNPFSENNFTARDIVVLITNFQLDSMAQAKSDNPFYADDIDIGMSIRDYSFMLPDSSYTLTIGDIGVSTADSSIFAEEVQISPRADHPSNREAKNLFEVFIPSVRLAGLRANELYFDKILNLNAFALNRPRISMITRETSSPQQGLENLHLYETLEKYFHRVVLDSFSIENGVFEQVLPPSDTTLPLVLPRFSFRLYRFMPDPLAILRPDRLLYSDDFEFTLHDYTLPLKDSLYLLELLNLKVNSAESSITLDSVTLFSNYDIYDYVVEHGYTIDYIELNTGKIQLYDADLYALFHNGDLVARQIQIEEPNLLIRKDKRFSQDPDRRPPVPQDLLKKFTFRIDVDSILLQKGIVNYFERVDRVERPGYIYLNNLQAVLKNVTNNPAKLLTLPKPEMTLRGEALIKGESKLEMIVHYPLGDTANPYTVEGAAGPMDLTGFNSILEPAAGVRVASGKALGLTFRMRGTTHNARGKMWFEYEDLKVSVVEEKVKDNEETQISERGFATAMANALVVRSSNPKRRFLRVGKIEYEADPSKVFVAHWLRALMSGVKSSIGIGGKDENIEKSD